MTWFCLTFLFLGLELELELLLLDLELELLLMALKLLELRARRDLFVVIFLAWILASVAKELETLKNKNRK
jgi:hypothetical protein